MELRNGTGWEMLSRDEFSFLVLFFHFANAPHAMPRHATRL